LVDFDDGDTTAEGAAAVLETSSLQPRTHFFANLASLSYTVLTTLL